MAKWKDCAFHHCCETQPQKTQVSILLLFANAAASLPSINTRAEIAAQNLCGSPNDYLIIPNTPWIVYSMNYNYQQISGSACTGYTGLTTSSSGTQMIKWNLTWDIAEDDNSDVVKGYGFVGLTQNLENTIAEIEIIPAIYTWERRNETEYKSNVCFDFMISDTKGDSTSTSAQELMLWLHWQGRQFPIGYADGSVAQIQLYNKTWDLYQGVNEDTGITVSLLLVDSGDMYDGPFESDIKDWLLATVDQGLFGSDTYVNVGNAGMEPFSGLLIS